MRHHVAQEHRDVGSLDLPRLGSRLVMSGSPFTIGPGGRITPRFGVMNGPVHVVSDFNVLTSERVHTGQGFVQETMGYPNDRLTAEYWFPWYDNITTMNWVLVGKP